jgi:hypothetical protein
MKEKRLSSTIRKGSHARDSNYISRGAFEAAQRDAMSFVGMALAGVIKIPEMLSRSLRRRLSDVERGEEKKNEKNAK